MRSIDLITGKPIEIGKTRRQMPLKYVGNECWNPLIPDGTFPAECERCLKNGNHTKKACYRPKFAPLEDIEKKRESRRKMNMYAVSRAEAQERRDRRETA